MDETSTPAKSPTNWVAFGIIIVFLIAVALLAGYFLLGNKEEKAPTTPPPSTTLTDQAEVKISKAGFSPEVIKLKKGTSLTWTNTDTKVHQPASDPHPTHDKLAELGDGEALAKGDSFSFTFEKAGSFTYHDHMNPLKFQGTVIVE